jgi:hypothetical protein
LFGADNSAAALRGAVPAKMILAQKPNEFRGFSISCTILQSTIAAKPCNAHDMLSELSWSWFAEVISEPHAPRHCAGAATETVLFFEDPNNRHQYPITVFDLDVCSTGSSGSPSDMRIHSVIITEDDIA